MENAITTEYDYSKENRGVFFLIDSKSFYASVENVERGFDPLKGDLVVMSEQANTNGGLVLAASPTAKKDLGISNVMRQRDLPDVHGLFIAHPRMNNYIAENLKINNIYRQYTDDINLLPYSIDESILDVTHSWRLFGKTPEEVAFKIQKQVRAETGVYLTVGIGEPIISNYQFNFMQQSKSGEINDDDTFIRILIDPTESERLQVDLKPGTKLVPQGLKFAFVGNNATDWTVYADTFVTIEEKPGTTSIKSSKISSENTNTNKSNK